MRWTEEQFAEYTKARDKAGPSQALHAAKPQDRMLALGRLPAGAMNKTEAAYANHLEALRRDGDVRWWKFEGVKLRLADNTFYTPDFAVMAADGVLEMHETKGFWRDDARVKIKVAAAQFPFRFFALKPLPKKQGGGWHQEVF